MHTKPTLFLTRPRPQSERFAALCRDTIGPDLHVVISPLLQIVQQHVALDPAAFGDVILTSENGARSLAALCDVRGLTAFCVGDQTARVASDLGMQARSAHGAADDLIALIRASDPKQPLLHARGAETRGEIAERLQATGFIVRSEVLYSQEPCDLSAEAVDTLNAQKSILAPIFSPRTARLFGSAVSETPAEIIVFPMSPAVAQAYSGPKARLIEPPAHPNAKALCDVIASYYSDASG